MEMRSLHQGVGGVVDGVGRTGRGGACKARHGAKCELHAAAITSHHPLGAQTAHSLPTPHADMARAPPHPPPIPIPPTHSPHHRKMMEKKKPSGMAPDERVAHRKMLTKVITDTVTPGKKQATRQHTWRGRGGGGAGGWWVCGPRARSCACVCVVWFGDRTARAPARSRCIAAFRAPRRNS